MWTNVFRIGDLRVISWFQFLPCESDPNTLPETSLKVDQKDATTFLVLSAHLQLQNKGFLSTWTNSFVGPWDPSQGVHNPDEKVKLWLFIPGRHSSVSETAQAAVSRLRVVGTGLWLAPGDSEEVAAALSQALKNSIERPLRGLSYMRFGDVFTRCHNSASNEKNFRRVQPTVEFVFAATEEAVYVHAVLSAKHVRGLCSDDMETVLKYHFSNSSGEGIPVIVAPNGMRGRLTGCRPSDLVKQMYLSKVRASNGHPVGSPFHVAQSSVCQLRGQSCYAEVTLGCLSKSLGNQNKNALQPTEEPCPVSSVTPQMKQEFTDQLPVLERTFLYPADSILVPIMHSAFARASLKRLPYGYDRCGSFLNGLGVEFGGLRVQPKNNSSSNSNTSSIGSISSTSCESDFEVLGANDLEADADSLMCKQSGLSSNDPFENDGHKMAPKRQRTGMSETFGQGTVVSATNQDPCKSEFGVAEVNNSTTAGVQTDWGWDDDDRSICMDIQTLLSEFGDFGDFFENDVLGFGEPPGTAESQAIIFSSADCGDVNDSPCNGGMDTTDQKLSPATLSSFEGFTHPYAAFTDELRNQSTEPSMDFRSSAMGSHSSAPLSSKFDNIIKAEAMMISAPEYAPVEIRTSDFSSSILRGTYLPRSKRVDSLACSVYSYGATPISPSKDVLPEKLEISMKEKSASVGQEGSSLVSSRKLYTYVDHGARKVEDRSITNDISPLKGDAASPVSVLNSSTSVLATQRKNGSLLEAAHLLLSVKTVPATEMESFMFQAAMCRIRHTLLSLSSKVPIWSNKLIGSSMAEIIPVDMNTATNSTHNKYEGRKKDLIPVRIAVDVDVVMHDGSITAPVGVWRSVGASKGSKPLNAHSSDNSPTLLHNTINADTSMAHGQRQPLHELLDALALLVQQSTSFVDVSLDTDDGEGSFCWLALQEQQRRSFCCGPSMVHAGCGGLLASCHSLDIAGVNLTDPLLADVNIWYSRPLEGTINISPRVEYVIHPLRGPTFASNCVVVDVDTALTSVFGSINPYALGKTLLISSCIQMSSVISLLQSDIKAALKSAFGNLDGPLPVMDWCKGRSPFGDSGNTGDGYSFQNSASDAKDSSSVVLAGEPMSPPQSAGGPSCIRDSSRVDEPSQRRLNQEVANLESELQKPYFNFRPTLSAFPLPSILVGYQDDWLKASVNCLQHWEKAPLEPYALPKPVTYYAVCPDIDLLTSSAIHFFQQLGVVYETCRLGTHLPHVSGNQIELSTRQNLPSGFVLVDCPQQAKLSGNSISTISCSDFFRTLAKGWDKKSFIKSLTKVLKDLKVNTSSVTAQKDGTAGPIMVVYVVCPFPEPIAVLQTLIECCAALGSSVLAPDRDRQAFLHSQVAKALNCTAAADEAQASNVILLSGFSIPKLVLQIVTVESLLRIHRPVNELAMLKEIAFTVYNKARRIPRVASTTDLQQSSAMAGRSQHSMMHVTSPLPGLWKDCLATRIPGPTLTREGDLDSTTLRSGSWDGSWQASRSGLNCDTNRPLDLFCQEDTRYMFEPLFILAEPGSLERGTSPLLFSTSVSETSTSKSVIDDSSGIFMQSSTPGGSSDVGTNPMFDGTEHDQKATSLHCCYGWTEDWRWLVCIWTDSRGELLDSSIFPFGGISSRQDTKVLQCLFVQILHQGCQILSSSCDATNSRPRDVIIARIGCFFELECQEWQKAIYSVGGSEVKKWPLQLRRSVPDVISSGTNSSSLQQQEMGLIQERNLPSSPSPSLYSPHTKVSGFMKGGLGQANSKKQLLAGQTPVDGPRGLLHLVQSITLVGVSVDHSLSLILPAEVSSSGGGTPNSGSSGGTGYVEGFSAVKSLGSMQASYLLIPSPSMRFLPPLPLQLPMCLTSESPPLAHLLHSKGPALPFLTGFVVSKAVPSARKDPTELGKEDWPSVLAISLVDHYGGSNSTVQEKMTRGATNNSASKQSRSFGSEGMSKDYEADAHLILESVTTELHSLSWMTASPVYLERRTALPFHCDMFLRLRRLLHFADKEFSRPAEQPQ